MSEPRPIRRSATAALRSALLQRNDFRCAVCGVSNDEVPLDLAYFQPLSQGGDASPENLIILCPNCHVDFDRRPREIEFTTFLVNLLTAHPAFRSVEQEPVIGSRERLRPDILAARRTAKAEERLVIECKTAVAIGTKSAGAVAHQLTRYAAHIHGARPVLAVPATLSEGQRAVIIDPAT